MNAIIRATAICSYSPPARLHLQIKLPPFAVTSGLVACSSTHPRRMNSLAICHLMERHFTAICRPSAPTARWQEGGAGVRLRRRLRSNAGRNVRASIERLRRDRVCHRAGTRCFRGHAPVAACLLQRAIACNAQRQIWHPWHHGQRGIRKLQFPLRPQGSESLSLSAIEKSIQ